MTDTATPTKNTARATTRMMRLGDVFEDSAAGGVLTAGEGETADSEEGTADSTAEGVATAEGVLASAGSEEGTLDSKGAGVLAAGDPTSDAVPTAEESDEGTSDA